MGTKNSIYVVPLSNGVVFFDWDKERTITVEFKFSTQINKLEFDELLQTHYGYSTPLEDLNGKVDILFSKKYSCD